MAASPRRPLVAGNLKMNGLKRSAIELEKTIAGGAGLRGQTDLMICPPATLLARPGAAAELLVEAAIEGLGIVGQFDDRLLKEIEGSRLEPVLQDWWPRFSGPFLYFPSRRLMPAPLRAFVDFLRA